MRATKRTALLDGRGPLVVCALRLRGGTTYVFGTEAAEITARIGPTLQVSPGLVIDAMESTIDPFGLSGQTALTQCQVSVVLPESLATLQGDFRYIGAATAEVARLWPGDVWEDRETMLAGTRLSGITIGIGSAPTTFTLEAAQPRTSAALGDASRTMDKDFANPTDQSGTALTDLAGVEYPQVWGAPYRSQAFKIGEIGGDSYDRLVIAGHHFADTSGVEVFEDGVSIGTFTVYNGTASSGPYAYVRAAASNVFDANSGAFTIAPVQGGIAARNGTNAAMTLGDLLELWLDASGMAVDWARCRPAIQRLRLWRGGVYMDAETPAVQAIRDHLVSIAPLVELQSADGLWLYYADFDTPTVRGTLAEGQELVGPIGGVSLSEIEDIVNAVTVRYALDEASGEFTATERVDGDTDAAAYVSAQLFGEIAADPIDAPQVKDSATARRVGRALIHRRAYQRRSMTWLVSDTADVEVGEVYALSAPTFGLSRNAVVVSILGVVARQVTFTVLDKPL